MRPIFIVSLMILITLIFLIIPLYDYKNSKQSSIKIGDTFNAYSNDAHNNDYQYKFYVFFAKKNQSPSSHSYIPFSNVIKTIGGTIRIFNIDNGSQYNKISSIVIITDANYKIVGMYPNKTSKDFISILELHPDLADFSLMKNAF